MCLVTVALVAQVPNKSSVVPTTKVQKSAFANAITGNETTPDNNIPELLRTPAWGGIGATYYDAVTNGGARNTISISSDGTAAAVWTMAETNASRGTGYNYFDGTAWGSAPDPGTGRVETVRTGWGIHSFLNNGEIIISHDGSYTGGLVINKRDTKGTGAWTETYLIGPVSENVHQVSGYPATSTCLLWPTVTVCGDTIHLFACTESDTALSYQGHTAVLVYYRSCDGGTTWENPRLLECLTENDLNSFSGDCYTVTSKNGKIVLLAGATFYDTYYCESNDGGTTWTKHMVYPFAGGAGNVIPDFNTDFFGPCSCNDGTMDVAIGDDGLVHVVFGTKRLTRDAENEAGYYSYYSFSEYDGIVYWNSSMQTLPELDSTYLSTYPTLIGRPNLDGDDTIWYGNDYTLEDYRTNGACTHPNIIAEDGKVYVTYASAMEYPYLDNINMLYFYGIFATVSNDNGTTWNVDGNTSWLSYNPATYFIDWENTNLYGEMFAIQEAENFWPSMSEKSGNGKLAVEWYWDYTPGQTAGLTDSPLNVFSVIIDKEEVGDFCNTQEVYTGEWDWIGIEENTLSEMKVYPNPATDLVNINFSSKNAENATIVVTNLLGQVVYNSAFATNEGVNNFQLNVSSYNAGLYIINIKTTTGVSSQKLIVK